MKILRNTLIGLFAVAALGAAATGYQVQLTFVNGVQRTVSELVIQGDRVILAQESLQVPFDQIKSAEFTFEAEKDEVILSLAQCEVLLKQAAYDELAEKVGAFLAPVEQALALPGNLDEYIQYKMRACFWTKQYDEMRRLAQLLQAKKSDYAPLAALYEVLVMIENGQPPAKVLEEFEKIGNAQDTSAAMTEYIYGRLALEDLQYEQALQRFSKVLVYYRRDPEWVPAATFQEGTVYKWGGDFDAMSDVRKELKLAYPDSYWSERAAELN